LYDPNLYAIDSNDGSILWSLRLGESSPTGDVDGFSEPAVGPDGTIYVNFNKAHNRLVPEIGYIDCYEPNLLAIDPCGIIKWDIHLGRTGSFVMTVGSDGLVYVAGEDGWLLVYDSNGVELSRFEGEKGLNYPAIASDGTLIVSDANKVWAIGGHGCEGQKYDLHWPEDLYGDGIVNFLDFALYVSDRLKCTDFTNPYSQTLCDYTTERVYFTGDINRDYYVDSYDFSDLKMLADRWLRVD
jgi:outer membrane protein assembly factor BamB